MDKEQYKDPKQEISVKLDTRIYPLDVVYLASYALLEDASVRIEGDPDNEITVNIRSKGGDIEKIKERFECELVKSSVYDKKSKEEIEFKSDLIRNSLLAGAESKKNDEEIEDPYDILIPWEEKYGEEN